MLLSAHGVYEKHSFPQSQEEQLITHHSVALGSWGGENVSAESLAAGELPVLINVSQIHVLFFWLCPFLGKYESD